MEDITMAKNVDKILSEIKKLEAKIADLRVQLPPEPAQPVEDPIDKRLRENRERRDAQVKRQAAKKSFEDGIAAVTKTAEEAFENARRARAEREDAVARQFAALYATSKQQAASLKLQYATWQVNDNSSKLMEIAIAVQDAAMAATQAISPEDPKKIIQQQQDLERKTEELREASEQIFDAINQGVTLTATGVDSSAIDDAMQEIDASLDRDGIVRDVRDAKIPGVTKASPLTGKDMLEALKKENNDD